MVDSNPHDEPGDEPLGRAEDDLEGNDVDDSLDGTLDDVLDGAFHAARDPAGLDSDRSVLDEVEARTGTRPSVALRDVDADPPTPMLRPLGAERTRLIGRYMVQGLLGEGGVGVVHKGHDTDLGRDVAMKFLHKKFRDQPAVLHRFIEEAQIGGQLQHPGIVPVYELGTSAGRPFFTMKMVKGQTLAKRLSERPAPAHDQRTFLSIFEAICQTMAYAHARGVVHRDLKPANIMIGSFGEVQVVDWGMGKVLPSGGVADERLAVERPPEVSVIETVRSGDPGTRSRMGSVMGTPAYMPPEQATGQVDRMDARSDVFALGAILCEILTGKPPYVGGQDELLGIAAMAKLGDAHERLQGCGAEADLVELTIRCLMPERTARPGSARVVAAAIHQHLASAEARIHDSRVEAAEARVRAASLKRTQRLGIALTSVIAGGLAASLWFWRDAAVQRGLAETNLANFNRLSHASRLETARSRERALYPARPDRAQAMRDWLENDAAGLQQAVPELQATFATLMAETLPQTEVERDRDIATHPRAAELSRLEGKRSAVRRAQAVRDGAPAPEPFVLDESTRSKMLIELHGLARPLVDPDRRAFGREVEGLALARHALSLAPATGDTRAMVCDTLAWALFAVGVDVEAVAQAEAAVAAATDERRSGYDKQLDELRAAVAAASGAAGRAALDELGSNIDALRAEIAERRTWEFADPADRFLHGTIRKLIAELEAFVANDVADVRRDLAWVERVEELTIGRYEERWREARAAILAADGVVASETYARARLELKPQLGLVPIGMNPQSKLWEFYHLRSAWDPSTQSDPAAIEIPECDEAGRFDVSGRGLVFVLIPGGWFLMGAQNHDPTGPNFDPGAGDSEAPVHAIELVPYLLAKHELTQGQWARLSGGEYPSGWKIGEDFAGIPVKIGDGHPVDTVSWLRCDELLSRYGLVLPTEAQWEFACRAGTSTPWFSGKDVGTLEGVANVHDQTAQNVAPEWPGGEAFDDGFKGPAPVGTFRPNAFGLHDVHGNVWEWCRDGYVSTYRAVPRAGDGLRDADASSGMRTLRGGAFRDPGGEARSAQRFGVAPALLGPRIGVRPARVITR